MRTISKSQLKTHLLRILRELEENGDELIVTDNNRPVLRISPLGRKRSVDEVFGSVRGQIAFKEDPDAPTTQEWEDC